MINIINRLCIYLSQDSIAIKWIVLYDCFSPMHSVRSYQRYLDFKCIYIYICMYVCMQKFWFRRKLTLYIRVSWKDLRMNKILLWNMTKWALSFNIVSFYQCCWPWIWLVKKVIDCRYDAIIWTLKPTIIQINRYMCVLTYGFHQS